jgi:hypothetical protein
MVAASKLLFGPQPIRSSFGPRRATGPYARTYHLAVRLKSIVPGSVQVADNSVIASEADLLEATNNEQRLARNKRKQLSKSLRKYMLAAPSPNDDGGQLDRTMLQPTMQHHYSDEDSGSALESAVMRATGRQELMQYVLERHRGPLSPTELVLVCNQLAKLCDVRRMPYRAWSEVKVGICAGYTSHLRVPGHGPTRAIIPHSPKQKRWSALTAIASLFGPPDLF